MCIHCLCPSPHIVLITVGAPLFFPTFNLLLDIKKKISGGRGGGGPKMYTHVTNQDDQDVIRFLLGRGGLFSVYQFS
jgi:hypothetical protein